MTNNCIFYIGDSCHHLYIHCLNKGIITAKQCMDCRKDNKSNVNRILDKHIKENKE